MYLKLLAKKCDIEMSCISEQGWGTFLIAEALASINRQRPSEV